MTSAEYNILCRTARQAYFAWQSAPAGNADSQIAEYKRAADALATAQRNSRTERSAQ